MFILYCVMNGAQLSHPQYLVTYAFYLGKCSTSSFSTRATPMPDMSTWTLYGQSKLANTHYCRALAQRHPDIKFVSIHPGLVKTNLGTEFMSDSNFLVSAALKFAMRFTAVNVREGAFNSAWAATNPAAESGVLYYPVGGTAIYTSTPLTILRYAGILRWITAYRWRTW